MAFATSRIRERRLFPFAAVVPRLDALLVQIAGPAPQPVRRDGKGAGEREEPERFKPLGAVRFTSRQLVSKERHRRSDGHGGDAVGGRRNTRENSVAALAAPIERRPQGGQEEMRHDRENCHDGERDEARLDERGVDGETATRDIDPDRVRHGQREHHRLGDADEDSDNPAPYNRPQGRERRAAANFRISGKRAL